MYLPARVARCFDCETAMRWPSHRQTALCAWQTFPKNVPSKQFRRWKGSLKRKSKVERLRLPNYPARTRFAPSPTGFLHLGSLRTALYNYLVARKTGGQFILRLEDTDQKRTVPDAERRLYEDLQWAHLDWDEGPIKGGPSGPYRQSERTALYQEHAKKLLDRRRAYRCFCSAERLDELARGRQAMGLPTYYDRQCAGLSNAESDERASKGEAYVVRHKAPARYPAFDDLLHGNIGNHDKVLEGHIAEDALAGYEDTVLIKSDGRPTYHFANVVDDHHMQITHVIRASEWMPSTPKHLALYQDFGWEPPLFLHVGLLVDQNGQKLSKRNFATDVQSYRNMGIFPDALLNFVALHGWSHDSKSDVMTLPSLLDHFKKLSFTKGNAVVNLDKLWYLQGGHAKLSLTSQQGLGTDGQVAQMMRERVLEVAQSYPSPESVLNGRTIPELVAAVVELDAANYTLAGDFYHRNLFFFQELDDTNRKPYNRKAAQIPLDGLFGAATSILFESDDWSHEALVQRLKANVEKYGGPGLSQSQKGEQRKWNAEICRFLRWVLFNGNEGPSIVSGMKLLGREICRRRLDAARAAVPAAPAPAEEAELHPASSNG